MNLYWPLVTPRPVNICVNYVSVKFSRMFISSCGIIFYFFSLYLYPFVRPYGMVGAGVWCVPVLLSGSFILNSTPSGVGVFTLRGAVSLDVCYTLGGATG